VPTGDRPGGVAAATPLTKGARDRIVRGGPAGPGGYSRAAATVGGDPGIWMADDSDGEDRRRWDRVPLHGEVLGRIYTEAAAPILDLSEGGALVEVPCVLRPRSLYTLRLTLDDGRVLALKASVVRSYVHELEAVTAGEARVRYRAAMHFAEMSDEDRALLERIPASAARKGEGEASDEEAPGDLVPALESEPERPAPGSQQQESWPTAIPTVEAWPTLGETSEDESELELVLAPELLADELGVTPEGPDATEEPSQPPAPESPSTPPAPTEESVRPEPPGLWSRIRGWLFPPRLRDGLRTLPDLSSPPERRDSSRVPLEGEIKGKMSLHLQSDVISLSEGGMLVRMPFAPVTGSVVGFTVEVGGRALPLRGTVRNAQETSDEEGNPLYTIGVEFLDLADDARRQLESYLAQKLDT